jgi:hypothetical protein
MGIAEQNLIMRVQYAIRKMRTRFAGLPNESKPGIKSPKTGPGGTYGAQMVPNWDSR